MRRELGRAERAFQALAETLARRHALRRGVLVCFALLTAGAIVTTFRLKQPVARLFISRLGLFCAHS